MASKKLQRIGVSSELTTRLKRHGIFTCKDFLSKNELELMKVTGLTRVKLRKLIEDVSKAVVPQHKTVLDIYNQRTSSGFFSTSLPPLDHLLHGGLPHGTITEIAGPPGCGKTQYCIMLSVLATLPHPLGTADGAVAYIDTESAFSAQRLVEIARCRFPDHFSQAANLRELCNRVHIYQESTCQELQERLDVIEVDIIRHGIKLIVIDSIASLVRKEFDSRLHGNMIERTNLLANQAATLKYIAESFSIPVVVTNQITTRIGQQSVISSNGEESVQGDSSTIMEEAKGFVTAALGNTWGHSVNTRLVLQYRHDNKRELIIAKSPVSAAARLAYTIESKGIVLADLEDGKSWMKVGEVDPGQQRICIRYPDSAMLGD